jgi:glyoxylase-like metal-dependent hydrolase (beta-lactamase superfamily II)/predicted ester cyclase
VNAGASRRFRSRRVDLNFDIEGDAVRSRLIALLCFATAAAFGGGSPDSGKVTRNIELLRQYYEYGKRGEHEKQAAMWSPAAINNGRPMKPEMIRVILEDIYRTFPDYESRVIESRAVGDTVVELSRISGTHQGVAQTNFNGGLLLGAKPTGRHFEVLVTHWWRFNEQGSIVWHQATRDDLGMMRQLGLIPDTLPADKLASTPTPSLVRAGVTEQLTAHVWAIPDGSANLVPNVGIIVGKKAVLVIDTGMGRRNAGTVLGEVAKLGAGKPIYIVTTHVHPEHDMGAHAFPKDSKLIRSKDQVEDIAAGAGMNLVPIFAQRSELNKELLADAKHRAADIIFDQDYTLDLGGVKAKIYAMGTNHTHGDTAVLVDGVLFCGDVAMKPQPAFSNPTATISHWLASLDRLQALHPKHIVPSHGPFGDTSIIEGYRAYLTRIRDRTAELKKAGKSQDEAIQIITEEMSAQYPDKNRLAGAIRAGYAEAA